MSQTKHQPTQSASTLVDTFFGEWTTAKELTGRQRGSRNATIVQLEQAGLPARRFAFDFGMDAEVAELCIGPGCLFKGEVSPVTKLEIIAPRSNSAK